MNACVSPHEYARVLRCGQGDFALQAVALDDDRVRADLGESRGIGDAAVYGNDACRLTSDADDRCGVVCIEGEDPQQLYGVMLSAIALRAEKRRARGRIGGRRWRRACNACRSRGVENPHPQGHDGDEQHNGRDSG